jgi:hypothetical protein
LQAGAYQNATFVVATAKCGVEDGHPLMGGTMIVDPNGEIVAQAKSEGDELVVADCDLDLTRFGKETVFDFARHRRVEHYGTARPAWSCRRRTKASAHPGASCYLRRETEIGHDHTHSNRPRSGARRDRARLPRGAA